jgi:hypothetical protein
MDWPWEGAVTPVLATVTQRRRDVTRTTGYQVTGDTATVLAEQGGKPTLVYWRGEGMKGGVLFDAGGHAPEDLRTPINRLAAEDSLGVELAGAIGLLAVQTADVAATVSDGAPTAPLVLDGVDALTGIRDPAATGKRSAALVARQWHGIYAKAANGVLVLGDSPILSFEPTNTGVTVRCAGLMQVVSDAETLRATTAAGAVPVIAAEGVTAWMVDARTPGIAVLSRPDEKRRVILLRSPDPVTLSP